MRLIIIFLLCLATSSLMSQTSVVYKRNPATGQLEVFESRGGLPTGQPLFKIKKNVYGYLEVENSGASQDPFTNKPDYSAYNNFKPYQLPAKEIFQTLETLNKRYEFDYVSTNENKKTSELGKEYFQKYFQDRSNIANAFFSFYQSNVSFPSAFKNGWYEVVNIYNTEGSSILGTSAGRDYKYGICKVENNKVVEYYENCNVYDLKDGYVFQKIKFDVISGIANCQSTFRAAGDNSYSTIYFLDNILDVNKQINNPNFAYYAIYTNYDFRQNGKLLNILIARNKKITEQEVRESSAGPYQVALVKGNPQTYDCDNSIMTLAFRNSTDKFSIGIYEPTKTFYGGKVWIINDIVVPASTCKATTINQ